MISLAKNSPKSFSCCTSKQVIIWIELLDRNLQEMPKMVLYVWSLGSIHIWRQMFLGISDLPIYPNQILYYISLCSKIRCSLTYLPKNLTSYMNAPIDWLSFALAAWAEPQQATAAAAAAAAVTPKVNNNKSVFDQEGVARRLKLGCQLTVVHEGTKSKIWNPDFLSLICHFDYPQSIQHEVQNWTWT